MTDNITPIRKQYLGIKKQYPQAIVFFRLGDFYETFDDDARTTSKELDIVLTSRSMGKGNNIPMAGIPYHAIDSYLARLINRGHKVAICEQISKPGDIKGIVQRQVVRIVTPGTVIEPGLLSSKSNNYLASFVIDNGLAGIAYIDITTGEFSTTQTISSRITSEIERIKPSEIILPKSCELTDLRFQSHITRIEDYYFDLESSKAILLEHFRVTSLDGYGCSNLPLAIRSSGSIIQYIRENQKGALTQVISLSTYSTEAFMVVDVQTQNNLELFRSSRSENTESALLSVLDLTKTAMGGRLLRKWIGQPLLETTEIEKRLDRIEWFFTNNFKRNQITNHLNDMADLERLINRIKGNTTSPRELISLKHGLEKLPQFLEILEQVPIFTINEEFKIQKEIIDIISSAINDQAPTSLHEGGVIKQGFSPELDEIRFKSSSSKQYIANLERNERERTGIKSLKIGFNRLFGYFIEISNSNLSQVPQEYIRKQTLSGGERFYTPELKEYESQILHAQEYIKDLEITIFYIVCNQVAAYSESILGVARILAQLDVFSSLAEIAVRNNYVRPSFNHDMSIVIKDGRHPVVERTLPENSFIPNDTYLSNDSSQLIILTGPNMSGKSTYLRQVALIVLMAQIGSYVPASSASIGVVDRIFTRIGAGEDLAAGKSTFMVEMTETANILNNATSHSLIILDEIGRGTSTYDGLSIARSVVEYIHNNPRLGSKTLFATHYHELVDLANVLPRVRNFNVAVSEQTGEVLFLRKIIPGGVDKSYGIHVAKIAGLPKSVVNRAQEILSDLEGNDIKHRQKTDRKLESNKTLLATQIPLFGQTPKVVVELQQLDINSLSPLEALNKLYELQKESL
jgi:DNA mismatch repair protein MutS